MDRLPEWVMAAFAGALSAAVLIVIVLLGFLLAQAIYALLGSIWACAAVFLIGLGAVVGIAVHFDMKEFAVEDKRKNDDLSGS